MAERLTVKDEKGTAFLKESDMKDPCEFCYEATQKLARYEELGFTPEEIAIMAKFFKEQTSVEAITADMKIAAKLIKLEKYEKLEEQGRLIIAPESFNVKTAVECITEYFCPSTFGLNNYTERCGHDDCKGCWLAALKGAENDNL